MLSAFRAVLTRRALALGGVGALGVAAVASRQPARALGRPVEISDMTWVEVRDAVAAGARTVIVPSGGIEETGPHMITGKHDRIVGWAARRIAAQLGDALVAPVISYVPQGDYDPPSGNLKFPGTIGVPPAVFEGVLDGIARSLKLSGFRTICFIADHGPSVAPQGAVAARLSREWAADGVQVAAVDSYYADAAETAFLTAQGETAAAIGEHATISDTSELMAVYPDGVDLSRLSGRLSSFPDVGVFGDPRRSTIAYGDAMMALKVNAAVAQIRAVTSRSGPT